MKAAIFKEAGTPVAIENVPDPEPRADEVVMKVGRCGICGTDLHMTSGHGFALPPGSMFGHEYAGEVVAVGKDVTRLKVGDRIASLPAVGCGKCAACLAGFPVQCSGEVRGQIAGFAEYIAVAEAGATILPQALSIADGALVEPLSVGLHGVALANIFPGARIAVVGAGSVGLAAIFWARQMGAGRIVATSPSARRAELAMSMGADAFETMGEGDGERINRALGGQPDIVFECAGAVGATGKSVDLVKNNGLVVSLGFCAEVDPLVPALATMKQVTIKYSFVYTLGEFQHCIDVLDRGRVEPRLMLSKTVSLDDFPATLEEIRQGAPHTKVHVDPWMS